MKHILFSLALSALIVLPSLAQDGVRTLRLGNVNVTLKPSPADTTLKTISAEDTILQINQTTVTVTPKKKHKKYYNSRMLGFNFAIPMLNNPSYYEIIGGSSFGFELAYRPVFAPTRVFQLGATAYYRFNRYKIHHMPSLPDFQPLIKTTWDEAQIKRHSFNSNNLAVDAFIRFHIPTKHKQKSYGGVYLDLGAEADWAFNKKLKLKTYDKEKVKYKDNYAFLPFTAYYVARFGWGDWELTARYRFTDAFNKKVLPLDLPPLSIGFAIEI